MHIKGGIRGILKGILRGIGNILECRILMKHDYGIYGNFGYKVQETL